MINSNLGKIGPGIRKSKIGPGVRKNRGKGLMMNMMPLS
jgi:hypothetical protein